MRKELDSSEIIAFCLKKKSQTDNFEISYQKIQAIGRTMEKECPFLHATYDMISIDAFRCEFSHYVEMRDKYLRINDVYEIYSRIQRYLPEKAVELKMEELNVEEL
jgi:hypothetical protein